MHLPNERSVEIVAHFMALAMQFAQAQSKRRDRRLTWANCQQQAEQRALGGGKLDFLLSSSDDGSA